MRNKNKVLSMDNINTHKYVFPRLEATRYFNCQRKSCTKAYYRSMKKCRLTLERERDFRKEKSLTTSSELSI